ncbi:hypothetical protein [Gordonia sp. UCD-TK1]|uniref:hypothetical protein n=1 Tax=Gordonia sp. UCD-TK1 TaxID=1857893 RepID=UPI00080ED8EE|nr:hypothetical protein [Gordonia sp. UCD-TK1]OCH82293.1 hypothetical protein A9310_14015 [Gordonia sp. UCD-TK1]
MEDSTSQGDQVTDDLIEDVTETEVQPEPDSEADLSGDGTEIEDPDTFPRSYVEQLRQENGKYRQRAQRADELANRLHRALVEQTGRLQDPSDLPFDETHLEGDNLTAAIDELLAKKPHLAARRVAGDVGQGASVGKGDVSLLGLLGGR